MKSWYHLSDDHVSHPLYKMALNVRIKYHISPFLYLVEHQMSRMRHEQRSPNPTLTLYPIPSYGGKTWALDTTVSS